MKREKRIVFETYCDVCGEECNGASYWWEWVTRTGERMIENFSPPGIDLCKKHIRAFDSIADKWKQERFDRRKLSDTERAELIQELKDNEVSDE